MRLELARVYQFTDEAQLFSVGLALDPRDAHNAQQKRRLKTCHERCKILPPLQHT